MEEYYVCKLSKLEKGVITPYTVNGIRMVLVNLDGDVKAFQALCPHQGFPLARFGKIKNNVLSCVHPGVEFCTESGNYLKQAPKCPNLNVYDVIVDNGAVVVRIPIDTKVKA
jgi:nitrite reductase/ring-hydroxylating ferredoxin subunit